MTADITSKRLLEKRLVNLEHSIKVKVKELNELRKEHKQLLYGSRKY